MKKPHRVALVGPAVQLRVRLLIDARRLNANRECPGGRDQRRAEHDDARDQKGSAFTHRGQPTPCTPSAQYGRPSFRNVFCIPWKRFLKPSMTFCRAAAPEPSYITELLRPT